MGNGGNETGGLRRAGNVGNLTICGGLLQPVDSALLLAMGKSSLIQLCRSVLRRSLLAGVLVCVVNFAAGAQLTNVQPGTLVVPPLRGQAATNQQRFLERLRHQPKKVEWEVRTFVAA